MLRLTAFVFCGFLLPAAAQEVGKPFPIKSYPLLQAQGEKPRLSSLAKYRGKKVLLLQFASW